MQGEGVAGQVFGVSRETFRGRAHTWPIRPPYRACNMERGGSLSVERSLLLSRRPWSDLRACLVASDAVIASVTAARNAASLPRVLMPRQGCGRQLFMQDTPPTTKPQATTSIRLEASILERTDKLVEHLSRKSAYEGLHLTRHEVLRMAILRGLLVLENDIPLPLPCPAPGA